MNIEEVREYCLALPFVTEDFPFDEHTLVLRVGNKIFALIPLEKVGQINLKCDPERAIVLREEYSEIVPGYHMSKSNWSLAAALAAMLLAAILLLYWIYDQLVGIDRLKLG